MNLIDKTLSQLNSINADNVIQTMGKIYDEPIDRSLLFSYPQFIQDIVFIIDLDTELSLDGILGLLENSTKNYISNIITALRNIKADKEADTLQTIHELYKINPSNEAIDALVDKLYLYTDFDIWSLLEKYVDIEMQTL